MADPLNYTLVRLDNNIPDNAVLKYDAVNDIITTTGLISGVSGELQAAAGSVNVGLQSMESSGEQVTFTNLNSLVTYAPPWHIVDESNPGGSMDRYYGPVYTVTRFDKRDTVVVDPVMNVRIPVDTLAISFNFTWPEAQPGVVFEWFDDLAQPAIWRQIHDVSAGEQDEVWKTPLAYRAGNYVFKIYRLDGQPLKVMGDSVTGYAGYSVKLREFTDKKLATEEFVMNHNGSGGTPVGVDGMPKSVYDANDNGVVDNAEQADKIKGIEGAASYTYYGKDSSGNVGFFPVPSSGMDHTAEIALIKAHLNAMALKEDENSKIIAANSASITRLAEDIKKLPPDRVFHYRGSIAPAYPTRLAELYVLNMVNLPSHVSVTPPTLGTNTVVPEGTIFIVTNETGEYSVKIVATLGQYIGGAQAMSIPSGTFMAFVLKGNDWTRIMGGFLPPTYVALSTALKIELKQLDLTHTTSQIRDIVRPLIPAKDLTMSDESHSVKSVQRIRVEGMPISETPDGSVVLDMSTVASKGVTFVNPDGKTIPGVTKIRLVGMQLVDTGDGGPFQMVLSNLPPDIPPVSTTSAYSFYNASATTPSALPSDLPLYRGGRVYVHKDTDEPQYAYILLPPGEGGDADKIGEVGGLPAVWPKETKAITVGGVSRVYTVFRSPYPFRERDVTFVIYKA